MITDFLLKTANRTVQIKTALLANCDVSSLMVIKSFILYASNTEDLLFRIAVLTKIFSQSRFHPLTTLLKNWPLPTVFFGKNSLEIFSSWNFRSIWMNRENLQSSIKKPKNITKKIYLKGGELMTNSVKWQIRFDFGLLYSEIKILIP